jgi:hypothetical protein
LRGIVDEVEGLEKFSFFVIRVMLQAGDIGNGCSAR